MSARLQLLNLALRATVKLRLHLLRRPIEARREFELFAGFALHPPAHLVVLPEDAGTPRLTWVWAGPTATRRVVLYFHGGGYVAGSPFTHRGLAGRLSRLSGLRFVLPAYRLAPEHPLPAAMEDARAAWDALRARGYRPGDIALAGDSAGGGIALSLLADLCAKGTRPAGVLLMSPFTDLTGSGPSLRENARVDPMLPAGRLDFLRRLVLNGLPAEDPRLSPLFADYRMPPPLLFQVSRHEILRDDTRRLAERLGVEGAPVEVQEWDRTPHVWQLFDPWLPEARAALGQGAAFLKAVLSPRP